MKARAPRKGLNFFSIRTSMIISFMVLISMIVLVVSLISYQYTINDFESLSINYTGRLLSEINASIDSYINNMKSTGQVVVDNPDVRRLMSLQEEAHKQPALAQHSRIEALESIVASYMKLMVNTRADITNIAVLSRYNDVVLSDAEKDVNPYADFTRQDWFLRPLSSKDEYIVSPSHVQNLVNNEYKWVISISKAITDMNTGEVTGVMVIDLNYRSIEDICENAQLGQSGYIYLIDRHKNIIYHPQQQLLYSGVKTELVEEILKMEEPFLRQNASNKLYIKNASSVTNWSSVGVVNTDELMKDKSSILRFYFGLAVASILFAAVIAVIISTTITKPIKMLENTMHRVEGGALDVRSEIPLNNEIGHLSSTFNTMVARIRRLMENAVSNEEEKRKSEIRALQAQINPHFLYNTLDTIIWMSASGKNEEVVEIASALAKLFRTSINKADSLVTMANEVENINSYLTIQKMRYGDKLTYRVNLPPETMQMMTPKLILQPIVENAVYHGIKLCKGGGEVRIGGALENGLLLLTVEDDGVGMAPETLDSLFLPKDKSDRGIGIINVNNRIKLFFGEEYGLRYASGVGAGTRVEIRLPAIANTEGADEE